MAEIFEVELPNGEIIEVESDAAPTAADMRKIYAASLPKINVDPKKIFKESTAMDRLKNVFTPENLRNETMFSKDGELETFKAAAIGDEVTINGRKVIKASDTDIVNPDPSDPAGAAMRAAGVEAPAAAAGAAAFGKAAASPMVRGLQKTPGLGKVAGFGIPLAAGMGGAIATSMATRVGAGAVSEELGEQLARDERNNPTATVAGSVLANAPFFGIGRVAPSLGREALNRAVPAAIGSGIQTGVELAGEEREGALSRIALAGAGNAIFNEPTKLGNAVIDAGANAFKKKTVTPKLGNASTKDTLAETTASVTDMAMNPEAINALKEITAPISPTLSPEQLAIAIRHRKAAVEAGPQPVKSAQESFGTLDPLTHAPSAQKSAETMIGEGAVLPPKSDVQLQLDQPVKPTPSPTPVQAQIEEALGLTKSRLEVQKKLSSRMATKDEIVREADLRTKQDEEIAAAIKAVDDAIGVQDGPVKQPAIESTLGQGIIGDGLRSTGEIPSEKGLPKVKYQYSVQAPQEFEGRKIPGFVQVDRIEDGVGTGSFTVEQLAREGIKLPVPPADLPSGKYTPDQVSQELGARDRLRERGSASIAAQGNLAAPLVGATVGYQFGDTPEEKRRNAVLGALIASGGTLSATALKSNPKLAKAIKEALVRPTDQALFPKDTVVTQKSIPVPGRPEIAPLRYVEIKDSTGVKFTGSFEDAVKAGHKLPEMQDGSYTGDKLSAASSPTSTFDSFTSPETARIPEAPTKAPDAPAESVTGAPSAAIGGLADGYDWSPAIATSPQGKLFTQILGEVETNIYLASPRAMGVLRNRQGDTNKIKLNFHERTSGLGKLARQSFSKEEFEEFSRAMLSGDLEAAQKMAATKAEGPEILNLIKQARETLEDAHAMQKEARGEQVGYVEDYFPREMVDYPAFRKFLGKEEQGAVDKALKAARDAKGRGLSPEEELDVINSLVAGSFRNAGKPGFLKTRTVEKITSDISKFYEPFDVSLENYLNKVANDVINRAYFGKYDPLNGFDGQVGGNFGEVIAKEREMGRLTPEAEDQVVDNLKALLKTEGAANNLINKIGSGIRKGVTAAYLGDFITAMAQFGDVFNTFQRTTMAHSGNVVKGARDTAKGYLLRNTKLADVGIHEGHSELFNQSRGRNIISKGIDNIMKFSVGVADQFNKTGAASAFVSTFSDIARNPDSRAFQRLNEKYQRMFPERWPKMLKAIQSDDFKNHKLNEDSQFFLFNEIADMQPISPAQMAKGYNEMNQLGKAMYSLKSYMIKQLNIMRKEGWTKMQKKESFAEGLGFMASYAAIVAGLGTWTVSAARDFILNREADNADYLMGGALQLFGLNRYALYKLKRGEIGALAAETVFPGVGLLSNAAKDLQTTAKFATGHSDGDGRKTMRDGGDYLQNLELIQHVPPVGREIYWHYGKGKLKEEKRESDRRRGVEQPNILETMKELVVPSDLKTSR